MGEEKEENEVPNFQKIRKNTKSSIDDINDDLKINTKRIMVIGASQTGKKSLVFSLFGEGSEESTENLCKSNKTKKTIKKYNMKGKKIKHKKYESKKRRNFRIKRKKRRNFLRKERKNKKIKIQIYNFK